VTQKLGQISKIQPDQILDIVPNFRNPWSVASCPVVLNTVVHHSSTSTYMPNFNRRNFLWTDGRVERQMHRRTLRPTGHAPGSITDDDDRRPRAKQYWPIRRGQ